MFYSATETTERSVEEIPEKDREQLIEGKRSGQTAAKRWKEGVSYLNCSELGHLALSPLKSV